MAQEFEKLDLAFNNAGGHADMKPIDQTTKKEPEWVIGLNFKAVYYGVKYEAECMLKGGGRLVNTASTFGLKAMPEIAHHAASKIAVDGHPAGFFTVDVDVIIDGSTISVRRAALLRTARLLMRGEVFVRAATWQGAPC